MNNKVKFQIQVRDFENCLLLSTPTLETDCSKSCSLLERSIANLKNEILDTFPDVNDFYFQTNFLNDQKNYFQKYED